VELRLAAGRFSPAQAADALDKQFLAWRGDGRELRLRLRVAQLRGEAGQYRQALALLRETEALWPEERSVTRARMAELSQSLPQKNGAESLDPVTLVSLAAENADLLPDAAQGEKLAILLADRLAALDLPRRSVPVLTKLMQATSGATRAAYGARLAAAELRVGDAADAQQALDISRADNLDMALTERRGLLQARILARLGKNAEALAQLGGLGTSDANELRAEMLEQAHDWQGAEQALTALVAQRVPAQGHTRRRPADASGAALPAQPRWPVMPPRCAICGRGKTAACGIRGSNRCSDCSRQRR
jgi:hypothetical protein